MTEHPMHQIEPVQATAEPIDPDAEQAAGPGAANIARALLRRWKLILAVWLLLAVPSAVLIAVLLKPTYTAIAQIEVAPIVSAILYKDEEKPIPFFDQYLNTQASIV